MAKKKKKKNLVQRIFKYRRLIILIIIMAIVAFLLIRAYSKNDDPERTIVDSLEISELIESIKDPEPIIEGQTKYTLGNGYTTIFNTVYGENSKTYTEYKQNLGSWSENSYWGGSMAENGCGITSIAIIASGYGSKATPEDLRAQYFPHLDADNMYTALQDLGIECDDFYFDKTYINEDYIVEWLLTGRPILACIDNTTENIWTVASHYLVLLDVNVDERKIYVSNPNGLDDTKKASNWYDYDEVIPCIVKAIFIESY